MVQELQPIKKFASWNGYPKNIVNAIMKRVLPKGTLTNNVISNNEKDKTPAFFININHLQYFLISPKFFLLYLYNFPEDLKDFLWALSLISK